MLVFNPSDSSCRLIGKELFGTSKYSSAVTGVDGCVYLLPNRARQVIRIDPEAETDMIWGRIGR